MADNHDRTEADRKATPPARGEGTGQKTSNERGAHTHNKKSPGKRPHQGG